MRRFYAVQHGNDFDWDYGSTVKIKAEKMANAMKRNNDYDGEEIRIAVINCDTDFCIEEIIIRQGNR